MNATPQDPVERDTLPKLFFSAIDRFGLLDALQYKDEGVWRCLSHHEVEERVSRLAAALAGLGVKRGDRVALLSENRPEWAIADYAILSLGAADVPIYPTLPSNQVGYILEHSGAKVILCSTPDQASKVLEVRSGLGSLEHLVAFDHGGDARGVLLLSKLYEQGARALESGEAPELRTLSGSVGPDDLATLIYTSGTTGDPKGVMLTHYNLCSNVASCQQHGTVELVSGDVALSFLPLSHVFERMVDYAYWDRGTSICYAESLDKVAENLLEVRPTIAVSVPRFFEKIYAKVTGASGIKKKLVMWAKGVGEEVAEIRLAGGEPSRLLAFQYGLADRLVFSKLRARTGGRLRQFVSGGAPLSGDIAKFFFAAGLPVYEGYGLSETSPVITANKPGAVRLGTVGLPLPGVEIGFVGDGEIRVRGPNVMKGYWQNEEATREVLDEEGWLRTGDVGELDADGFLKITDRLKNILVTAGGKNIAPAPLEIAAAMSPYVAQAVMIGDRRPFPALLVVPDFERLEGWAREQGIDSSDRDRLSSDERVHAFLAEETLGRLESFASYETPKKVAVLAEEFAVDSGELTPTMKVKRRVVEERYARVIEELYRNS